MVQISVTNMFCWSGMMCQKAERNQKALGKGHFFRHFAFSCPPPCCCPASLRHMRCVKVTVALFDIHRGCSGQNQRPKSRLQEKLGRGNCMERAGLAWNVEDEWLQASGPEQAVTEHARQGCRSVGKEESQGVQHSRSSGHTGFECLTKESGHSFIGPRAADGTHQRLVWLLPSCAILCKVRVWGLKYLLRKVGIRSALHPKGICIVTMTRKSRGRSPRHSPWHTRGQLSS